MPSNLTPEEILGSNHSKVQSKNFLERQAEGLGAAVIRNTGDIGNLVAGAGANVVKRGVDIVNKARETGVVDFVNPGETLKNLPPSRLVKQFSPAREKLDFDIKPYLEAAPHLAEDLAYADTEAEAVALLNQDELIRETANIRSQFTWPEQMAHDMLSMASSPINVGMVGYGVKLLNIARVTGNVSKAKVLADSAKGAVLGASATATNEAVFQAGITGKPIEESVINVIGDLAGGFVLGAGAGSVARGIARSRLARLNADTKAALYSHSSPDHITFDINEGPNGLEVTSKNLKTGEEHTLTQKEFNDSIGAAEVDFSKIYTDESDFTKPVRMNESIMKFLSSPFGLRLFRSSGKRGFLSKYRNLREFTDEITFNDFMTKGTISGTGRTDIGSLKQIRVQQLEYLHSKVNEDLVKARAEIPGVSKIELEDRLFNILRSNKVDENSHINRAAQNIRQEFASAFNKLRSLDDAFKEVDDNTLLRMFTTIVDPNKLDDPNIDIAERIKRIIKSEFPDIKKSRLEKQSNKVMTFLKDFSEAPHLGSRFVNRVINKQLNEISPEFLSIFKDKNEVLEDILLSAPENLYKSSLVELETHNLWRSRFGNRSFKEVVDDIKSGTLEEIDVEIKKAKDTLSGKKLEKRLKELEKDKVKEMEEIESTASNLFSSFTNRTLPKGFSSGEVKARSSAFNTLTGLTSYGMLGNMAIASINEMFMAMSRVGPTSFFIGSIESIYENKLINLFRKTPKGQQREAAAKVGLGLNVITSDQLTSKFDPDLLGGSALPSKLDKFNAQLWRITGVGSGMAHLFNATQTITFRLLDIEAQSLLRKAASGKRLKTHEISLLAEMGIDKNDWGPMIKQMDKHYQESAFGLTHSNAMLWDNVKSTADSNRTLSEVYLQGLAAQTNRLALLPTAADVPPFFRSNILGRLMWQFKSWASTIVGPMTVRGLQSRDVNTLMHFGALYFLTQAKLDLFDMSMGRERETDPFKRWSQTVSESGMFGLMGEPIFELLPQTIAGRTYIPERNLKSTVQGAWTGFLDKLNSSVIGGLSMAGGNDLTYRQKKSLAELTLFGYNNPLYRNLFYNPILGEIER